MHTFRPTTSLKRNSSTCAFLWILHILSEKLFWKAPVNTSFCLLHVKTINEIIPRYVFLNQKKYQANICPQIFLKNYTFVACFYYFWYARVISSLTQAAKNNTSYNFSFCHWNLNSIAVHSFLKLLLLEAYNMQHKFDMNCFSETFLDFSIPTNVEKLNMKGYKLIRAGNPNDSKKDCAGICEFLALCSVEVWNQNECIIFEVTIKNNSGYVVSL